MSLDRRGGGCSRHRAQDPEPLLRVLNRPGAPQQRVEGAPVRGLANDVELGALVGILTPRRGVFPVRALECYAAPASTAINGDKCP